ncbi:hypothetical protein [Martelella endophytica]|uniref:Uncharacterized protein n=1 Tax=Martelella endophytica TaxID=1486262 RepID=A0A0D5LNK9_MAREN|nr:hypothetical protein [Martelella endophytica]AJY45834.1 hypothetical protein TM49_09270 [Martelella endophytica]
MPQEGMGVESMAQGQEEQTRLQGTEGRQYRRPSSCSPAGQDELARLEDALMIVARLIDTDPVYVPIFERLEREIELEKEKTSNSAVSRARLLLAQNEIG